MIAFILLMCKIAFAVDMSGIWTNEDGTKIIIPFLRDGNIPILCSEASSPLVPVWGRWSYKHEHLQFADNTQTLWRIKEGYDQDSLTVEKGEQIFTLIKKAPITKSKASGIWIGKSGDEFIPIVAGNKIYVLHRNKQQITKVYLGHWQRNNVDFVLQFKAKKKCTVVFNSNTPLQAQAICGKNDDSWRRHYTPSEMDFIDLSGRWRAGGLVLKIELDGIKWKEASLEQGNSITVYQPEWAGGIPGRKFYLRHPEFGKLLGTYHDEKPVKIILRIQDQDVSFYQMETD
jgi:hypothetical protein